MLRTGIVRSISIVVPLSASLVATPAAARDADESADAHGASPGTRWVNGLGLVSESPPKDAPRAETLKAPPALTYGRNEGGMYMGIGASGRRSGQTVEGEFSLVGRYEISSVAPAITPLFKLDMTGSLNSNNRPNFFGFGASAALMWHPFSVRWFSLGPLAGYRGTIRVDHDPVTKDSSGTGVHIVEPGVQLRVRSRDTAVDSAAVDWFLYVIDRTGSDVRSVGYIGTTLWFGGYFSMAINAEAALARAATIDAMAVPLAWRANVGFGFRSIGAP